MSEKNRISADEAALRYLDRGSRSCFEVRQALKKKEYTDDEIEAAVSKMLSYGYLDDERYAEMFIRSQKEKGRGIRRIREELIRKRGVDSATVSLVLSDEDFDERKEAELQAEKLVAGREMTPELLKKVARRLSYLGYGQGDIAGVLRELRRKLL